MASDPAPKSGELVIPDAASQISGLVFALMLIDPEGRVAQVNHATEVMLGTSAKRLLGKALESFFKPLDTRAAYLLASGEHALVARDVRVRFAGAENPVNLTMSPMAAYPGWRVVTVSQLVRENSSSDDSSATSVGAPSILAHEIKNPLAAIKGAAQLIARKLPQGDKALSKMITDEVDRIARLIDRMQQLGSQTAEAGCACNPHEAIRSAVATVRAGGMEGVEIIEEFDPSLPPVLAHRDALEQALINLISNARDACRTAPRAGGETGRITIRTRYVSGLVFNPVRFGRSVRLPVEIAISDNGKGVDPALRDRLFEPFVSSKSGGQGLGLALVRKLMQDMNGSITHERETGRGLTHFRLHLPVAPNEPKPKGTA